MAAGSTVEVHHLLRRPRGRASSRTFGLRDATGNWMAAMMLYGGIILARFVLLCSSGTSPEPG